MSSSRETSSSRWDPHPHCSHGSTTEARRVGGGVWVALPEPLIGKVWGGVTAAGPAWTSLSGEPGPSPLSWTLAWPNLLLLSRLWEGSDFMLIPCERRSGRGRVVGLVSGVTSAFWSQLTHAKPASSQPLLLGTSELPTKEQLHKQVASHTPLANANATLASTSELV